MKTVLALGRNLFESARKIARARWPALVTHGEPDNTIPTARGRALYENAPSRSGS